jgi:hypothetical protein
VFTVICRGFSFDIIKDIKTDTKDSSSERFTENPTIEEVFDKTEYGKGTAREKDDVEEYTDDP